MDQAGPSSYRRGSSSHSSTATNSPRIMTPAERAAAIEHLYEVLGRKTSKDEIESALEVSGDNADFAYTILVEKPPEPELRDQKKMIEDHEVLGGIFDMAKRDDIREIIRFLPQESSCRILEMYNHCRKNQQETITRLLDGYSIPTKESNNNAEGEEIGTRDRKGKGKEIITQDRTVKSALSLRTYYGSSSTARASSSESEDHPNTPSTSFSSSSQSPKAAIPLRPAPWGFNQRADNPEVSATKVETDNEGYDIDEPHSDVEMKQVKDELEDEADEDEDDIYEAPAEDRVAHPESQSEGTMSAEASDVEDHADASGTTRNGNVTDDVDMTREAATSEDEAEVELSNADKEAQLKQLFPKAIMNDIRRELALNEGNMEAAAEDLELEFGLGGSEASSERDRSISPGVGPSRTRKPENRKRCATAMDEGRQSKRSRCEKDKEFEESEGEESDEHDAADQWVLTFLHVDTGIHIELDSGLHPCRIPDNSLRRIPGFRSWLDANPARAGIDRTMKVSGVSMETFNLAMQWAVCSTGRLTPAQRKTKSTGVTALVDLAVFASSINLSLGKASGSFMTKLKALIVKHRNSLTGAHIRRAFENLDANHQVCSLFVQASIRPYAEFYYSNDVRNMIPDFESEPDDDLNPAQRAAYHKARFCYHSEFNTVEEYQSQLLKEFHRIWWARSSRVQKHGRSNHYCHLTSLTDPLTGEEFHI